MQGVVLLGGRDKTKQGGNARYTKHRNTGDGRRAKFDKVRLD